MIINLLHCIHLEFPVNHWIFYFVDRPDCGVKSQAVERCTYCYFVKCATLIIWVRGMSLHKPGATHYNELGIQSKGRAKRVVCLQNSMAVGSYQASI